MTANRQSARLSAPPALLADGAWYGTLAAVRDLGMHGVPVTLATDTKLVPARWSKHVTSTVDAPATGDRSKFLQWLLEFGKQHPGHVLYPTSDDVAWLVAANIDELREFFLVSAPPLASLVQLLDKARLVEHARACGLDTPETRVPKNEEELEQVAQAIGFPAFVKQRMQLFGARGTKGMRVASGEQLLKAWRSLRYESEYDPVVSARVPDVELPVVQSCAEHTERIYTLNGYFDAPLDLWTCMACVKVLQRPRGKGAGVVFEHAEVVPEIAAKLRALLRATNYSGVFDAEFLESGDRRMLIDINPRFYNHMAFEVERGMPLPWYTYLAACGRTVELAEAIARFEPKPHPGVYVHRIPTGLLLLAQSLSRGMTSAERQRWRSYLFSRRSAITDPVTTPEDPRPLVGEIALEAHKMLRHPRSFLRGLFHSPH